MTGLFRAEKTAFVDWQSPFHLVLATGFGQSNHRRQDASPSSAVLSVMSVSLTGRLCCYLRNRPIGTTVGLIVNTRHSDRRMSTPHNQLLLTIWSGQLGHFVGR
ncbi:unnamed protein product [Protopolystoma xenopodis]|uniref:Uncharacterized protein n=1 Tax=Protopolystoma xenopodis TaxID=117903 RepID=A0A3S5C609_9PLAT|nr:unnamed protein product [Protopolystoma xenopodis]